MLLSASEQAAKLGKLNHTSILTKTIISLLIEIFRRLNAFFTPLYTSKAVHASFSVGTSPATRKTQSFVDYDENSVISLLMEILLLFSALFTPFYMPTAVHATFCIETFPASRKTQSSVDFDENSNVAPD
jgi:hypothetical protein